jgi:ABC-type transporter Mla subunit MlaD
MASNENRRNNVRAGIFTLVALALGFATIVVLNADSIQYLWGEHHRYVVRFTLLDGVGGLSPGSEVRVGGLVRGRVTDIRLTGIEVGDKRPPEALVDIEVDRSITLWSNAEAIRTVPILGGSSWINITTVGGPDLITRTPGTSNGDSSTKLPFDGTGEIPATPGDGLLTTIVGPQNAVTTQQLLENVASFTRFLDRDVVLAFDDEIRPTLADARGLVGDVRTDYGQWRKDLDRTFDSVASAADRLDGAMDQAAGAVGDARDDLRMIGELVRRNVGRIDAAIANVEVMTEDGVAITHRLRDETLARVDDALDAGANAISQLSSTMRRIDLEIANSIPQVQSFLQDALVAAGELKLATIEIRRSPWRILYQPQPGELANENLFAAARDFTIAAGEVRTAASSLQSMQDQLPEALRNDPEMQELVQRLLTESLRRLETAQSRLFSVIVGEVGTGDDGE